MRQDAINKLKVQAKKFRSACVAPRMGFVYFTHHLNSFSGCLVDKIG